MVTLRWLMASLRRIEHGLDGADRRVELFGDVAVGALELARAHQRAVEFVRKPRTVRAERLNAGRQLILVAIRLAPPFHRAFQRIERGRQPPRRSLDIGRAIMAGSALAERLAGRSFMFVSRAFRLDAAGLQSYASASL